MGVLISRKMTPKSTLKISPLLLKTSRAGNSQLTPDIHAITSYCENVLSPHLLIRKATMAGYRTPTKCSALVQQHVEGCGNRKYKVTLRHNPCSLEPLKKWGWWDKSNVRHSREPCQIIYKSATLWVWMERTKRDLEKKNTHGNHRYELKILSSKEFRDSAQVS